MFLCLYLHMYVNACRARARACVFARARVRVGERRMCTGSLELERASEECYVVGELTCVCARTWMNMSCVRVSSE